MVKWCEIKLVLPENEAKDLIKTLNIDYKLQQIDEDWCTNKRSKDNAYLEFSPCDEPRNRKIDW